MSSIDEATKRAVEEKIRAPPNISPQKMKDDAIAALHSSIPRVVRFVHAYLVDDDLKDCASVNLLAVSLATLPIIEQRQRVSNAKIL